MWVFPFLTLTLIALLVICQYGSVRTSTYVQYAAVHSSLGFERSRSALIAVLVRVALSGPLFVPSIPHLLCISCFITRLHQFERDPSALIWFLYGETNPGLTGESRVS